MKMASKLQFTGKIKRMYLFCDRRLRAEHGELIRYLGYNGSEYIEGEAI